MKQLAEDADGRTDPTERLIGYRLVQIVANYIHSATSRSDRDEVANHLLSMENHEDPNVRLLALNVARARRFNVPSPEPTGVMATPLEAGWTAGADWDTNWAAESRIDWSASPGLPIVVTSPAFGRPRARGRAFSRARGRGRGRGRG
ncbi:hypothetical protein FRB91_008585 [Serendipita sp. 411]|nr:hypothetical protein FRB91_008585 [Serendipita sp. 411]